MLCYYVLLYHTMLCYAVLSPAAKRSVPCCDAVLLCRAAVPCYAVLCRAMPCYAVLLCLGMPCVAMLFRAFPCNAVLLCHDAVLFRAAMLCYALLCHATVPC